MKVKKAFKDIFLKTAGMFFTFYLIVAIGCTGVYYRLQVDENKANFDNMFNVLIDDIDKDISEIENERLSEGRTEKWTNDADNPNALNKDISKLTELNSEISYLTSSFSKEMFARAYLYDENFKMIAKSRNMLRISSFEDKKSKTDYLNINRYIDLDKYLSEDEKIDLFKIYNQNSKSKDYFIKGQGYANGVEIIPEVIDIYESTADGPLSVDEGIESGEKIKTYKFSVEKVEGLKKIDIATFFENDWEIHYNNEMYNPNNSNELYKKAFERYNNIKDCNENEVRSLANENNVIHETYERNNFFKIEYNYANTIFSNTNNHRYFLYLKADYYPWEDILPKAIPLYLISFIMVLAMTLILSKGLYKTYEKQEALEKNRRELTSAIAHELKIPLGIIRTYGEGLKEKIAEDKRDYYLDIIIDETYKMDKMVLEMLDLSKLEAKAYELKKEEFCLNDLVEEIIKKNEKLFNDKNINVSYNSDKKYNIHADYVRIEQVINNLISNAIYHTEEKKAINITLENQTVSIENEGENIPDDKINLIWDTFYRGDDSRARSERRTGIGLAIVKNILKLHNMEFGAQNTKLGVKFWFKLF